MYISSLSLKNFRCYRQAETTFVHPDAEATLDLPKGALNNVTLLVGVNGSGKTSILRAVALGVLAPVINESGFRPYYLVRRAKAGSKPIETGQILLKGVLDESETREFDLGHAIPFNELPDLLQNRIDVIRRNDYDVVQFTSAPDYRSRQDLPGLLNRMREGKTHSFVYNKAREPTAAQFLAALDRYYEDFSSSYFLLGYGAGRRAEDPSRTPPGADKSRGRRYLRTAGLFEEGITLSPLAGWLPQIKRKARFAEVVKLLNQTLPVGTKFTGRFRPDKQPLFSHNGVELPFPALSDGYRSYVGLLGDILCHLHECCPPKRSLTDMTGVVMVDDIEMHLHPKWQRVVVPRLAKTFKNLQFILSTHSPLVAGSVHAANVRVIGKNQVHEFAERLHGLSVDQILSSRYFSFTTPRSDESEKKLQELLEGAIDDGDADSALEFLKELAGENPAKR